MEALAALSVASNVIQIVEFGTKLAAQSLELYRDGKLGQHEGLENVVNNLNQATNSLSNQLKQSVPTANLTKDESELLTIAGKCQDVSAELLAQLDDLKLEDGPLHKKRRIVKKVIKSATKKTTIERLSTELEGYREVLDTQVLVRLRYALLLPRQCRLEAFYCANSGFGLPWTTHIIHRRELNNYQNYVYARANLWKLTANSLICGKFNRPKAFVASIK